MSEVMLGSFGVVDLQPHPWAPSTYNADVQGFPPYVEMMKYDIGRSRELMRKLLKALNPRNASSACIVGYARDVQQITVRIEEYLEITSKYDTGWPFIKGS